MTIKMNNRNRSIGLLHAPEDRQHNGMVTAKRDNPRQYLPTFGRALSLLVRSVRWRPGQEAVVPLLNLLDGVCVIVGRDGDIAAVQDSRPGVEGVHGEEGVVAAAEGEFV